MMSHDLLVQMAHYGRIYLINMIAMLREGTFYQDTKNSHPQNSKSLYRSNLRE